jgi:hypothetical protein
MGNIDGLWSDPPQGWCSPNSSLGARCASAVMPKNTRQNPKPARIELFMFNSPYYLFSIELTQGLPHRLHFVLVGFENRLLDHLASFLVQRVRDIFELSVFALF